MSQCSCPLHLKCLDGRHELLCLGEGLLRGQVHCFLRNRLEVYLLLKTLHHYGHYVTRSQAQSGLRVCFVRALSLESWHLVTRIAQDRRLEWRISK